jgi:hypothetical protein
VLLLLDNISAYLVHFYYAHNCANMSCLTNDDIVIILLYVL